MGDHRILFLVSFSFFMGVLAGPLIHQYAELKPELLIQAVAYTGVAFSSFSAMALFSKRRSYLFLGSVISSIGLALFFYSIFGLFFGGARLSLGYIVVTLVMTCMWIIFDTQIIVEQAERGHTDVPNHALE